MSDVVKSNSRAPLLAVVVVLALAPLLYLTLSAAGLAVTIPGVERMRVSPDVTATTLEGDTIRLADLRGQPVVLNFWASWCPPCRAEMPEFERVWQTYAERGVVMLGVNTSDQADKARTFLLEAAVSYPHLVDNNGDIARLFSATSLPTTVFIDREGRMVSRRVGALNAQTLAQQIEDLLQ